MNKHAFFLSGKSSGSSIFQRELLQHPDVSAVQATEHTEHETLYWVKAASVLGIPERHFYRGKCPYPSALCERALKNMLRRNAPDFSPKGDSRSWIYSGWDAMIDQHHPVFFEKSPHHLEQWPALMTFLDYFRQDRRDVVFIAMVRNPMAVIYSTFTRWHSDLYARQFWWMQAYSNLLTAMQLIPSEKFLLLRYEDFIEAPKDTLDNVCQFLGISRPTDLGINVHERSANKWVEDKAFTFQLDPIIERFASQFGYTKEELHNPINGKVARTPSRLAWAKWKVKSTVGKIKSRRKPISDW